MSKTYKADDSDNKPVDPYQLEYEVGHSAFVTTGLTIAVRTNFDLVTAVLLTPDQGVEAEQLGSDRTLSSGAITIERPASTTSGLGFSYIIYGKRITV